MMRCQLFSAEGRSGDWLGPRFKGYAARIRSLVIRHRVVNRERYPIQSSDWVPSISMRSIRECTITSRDHGWLNESVTSSVSLDVLQAWYNCSRDSAVPLFPNLSDLLVGLPDAAHRLVGFILSRASSQPHSGDQFSQQL
jgi:hypothetical protein